MNAKANGYYRTYSDVKVGKLKKENLCVKPIETFVNR
ncbi:hypothetical protein SAMN05216464_103209 [Mucilaginibacter pineti]|uniref:Uncharacterized protein n=1 Tax=Mucilaginibacter pineti TaxID=1391627 RepID=A0A1G6Z409_9SPHI|nr:hypothetical protein SAMN05216464_103209 [Mucilaginibacter pineti]